MGEKIEIDIERLNSLDFRLKNLVETAVHTSRLAKIIELEKLPIPEKKDTMSLRDYEEYFKRLDANQKQQVLAQWEISTNPIIQINQLEDATNLGTLRDFINDNRNIIWEKYSTVFLREEKNDLCTKFVFLRYTRPKSMLIQGKFQTVQETYFLTLVYHPKPKLLEFRSSRKIDRIRSYILQGISISPSSSKLILTKKNVERLARTSLAKNASIDCEGEMIQERGYRSQRFNLFDIREFLNALKKPNYKLKRLFVTLDLSGSFPLDNQINIRIFPVEGKFTFTGFVKEDRIQATIDIIEKVVKETGEISRKKQIDLSYFLG